MVPANFLPGISVVIPAYNYAGYLPLTIDSVLRQDYPNIEIVLVDDGSTDNTREVVAAYGDKVRYVWQKNAGLPAARNTGIRHSSHDYVAFIDADDIWQPAFLSRLMETFLKLPEDFAAVSCYIEYIDAKGALLPVKNFVPVREKEVTKRDLLLKNRITSSSTITRKRAFLTCGFYDETLRSSEDRDIWLRIAAQFRFYMVPVTLSQIRRHSSNMSKHADRMKANVRKVLGKAYASELVGHGERLFWLRVASFYFFQNCWRYRDEGRMGKALAELLCSLVLWPYFPEAAELNEPRFFRLRSLVRFGREWFSRRPSA